MPSYDEETNKVGRCNRKADSFRANVKQAGDSFARKFIRGGTVNRHCCLLENIQAIDQPSGYVPSSGVTEYAAPSGQFTSFG